MVYVVLGRITARIATNGITTVITTNCSNTIALLNHKLYKFLTQKQYKSRGYDNDRYITTRNNLSILFLIQKQYKSCVHDKSTSVRGYCSCTR